MQPSLHRKLSSIRVSLGEKKFSLRFGKGCVSGSGWGRFSENYCHCGHAEDKVKTFSWIRR
jgi:hypothetical protein